MKSRGFASVNNKSNGIKVDQVGILAIRNAGTKTTGTWMHNMPPETVIRFGLVPKVDALLDAVVQRTDVTSVGIPKCKLKRRLHVWYLQGMAWELMFYELAPPVVDTSHDPAAVKLALKQWEFDDFMHRRR